MARMRVIGDVIEFDGYRVGLVVEGAPPSVVTAFKDALEGAVTGEDHNSQVKTVEDEAHDRGYEVGSEDARRVAKKEAAEALHPFVKEALKAIRKADLELSEMVDA